MSKSRSIQLFPDEGSVHKYWQCHNKSFLIEKPEVKDLYLKCTEYGLKHKSINNNVILTSYCIMSNHTHMGLDYENSSVHLSNFMRISHSRFGFKLNKINGTSGKIANSRPKTPLIEDPNEAMIVHFYIEANMVRAGMIQLEKLRFMTYSSYGFYAHGIKTKWTHLLTPPDWYIALGKTAKERQAKYRKYFKEYLESKDQSDYIRRPYIGSYTWQDKMRGIAKEKLKEREKEKAKNKPPPAPPPPE